MGIEFVCFEALRPFGAKRAKAWRLAAGACCAAALLALGGCGGGGGAAPVSSPTDSTPITPTTPPATSTASVTPTVVIPTVTPTVVVTPSGPALSAQAAAFLDLNLANLASYTPVLPAHYDAAVTGLDNAPPGSAASDRIATLGRVLFHDKRLSVNDTIACASCHQQALTFDDRVRFSVGFAGNAFTTAHAMRLGNVRYFRPGSMFWDRRAASLEAQATQPIQNPVEMGFDASNGGLPALLSKMQGLVYYPELFAFAFGTSDITEVRIQQALGQFQRAMVSSASLWDSGYAQVYSPLLPDKGLSLDVPGLTAQENRGRLLFINGPGNVPITVERCRVTAPLT